MECLGLEQIVVAKGRYKARGAVGELVIGREDLAAKVVGAAREELINVTAIVVEDRIRAGYAASGHLKRLEELAKGLY